MSPALNQDRGGIQEENEKSTVDQETIEIPPTPEEIILNEKKSNNEDFIANLFEESKPYLLQIVQYVKKFSKGKIKNIPVSVIFFVVTSLTAMIDIYMPLQIILFILRMCIQFVLSVIGIAIAIGLGMGFGAHIYETLDKHSLDRALKEKQQESYSKSDKPKRLFPKSNYITATSDNGDASYFSLMARSGYPQPSKTMLLRGQLRPRTYLPPEIDYNIVGVRATTTMNQMWPNLPKDINKEFGMLVDYIVRDYVVSWFGSVDAAVVYKDPTEAKRNADEKASKDKPSDAEDKTKTSNVSNTPDDQKMTEKPDRILAVSTASYKAVPFLNTLTSALSHLIGQLCTTAADNVNVVDLVLIKIVKAITKTLKHYRRARKVALLRQASYSGSQQKRKHYESHDSEGISDNHTDNNKSGSENERKVSEIAITKELLISNRLHKAITFGLDVPSLLFADPKGQRAPPEGSNLFESPRNEPIEDSVLHDRLYNTSILAECELDYNRVISNKICRKLVPAADLSSPMIKSFGVEVVAGSVLTPIMSFFVPECINGYIVQGLESYLESTETGETGQEFQDEEKENELDFDSFAEDLQPTKYSQNIKELDSSEISREGVSGTDRKELKQKEKTDQKIEINSVSHQKDGFYESSNDSLFEEDQTNIEVDVDDMNDDFDTEDGNREGEDRIDGDDELEDADETDEFAEDINDDTIEESSESEQVLPILTLAVIDVQNYGQIGNGNNEIDWEHENCRAAVCHLVLVIEAALQHGRRVTPPQHNNSSLEEVEDGKSVQNPFGTSLVDLLMDMTMNIDAFQKSLREKEAVDIGNVHDEFRDENTEKISKDVFKQESSTLRTMIVAWLQTGDIYKAIQVFVSSKKLRTCFYNPKAFFRQENYAEAFCSQLRILDGVDVLVDTMAVLESDGVVFDSTTANLDSTKSALPKNLPQPSSVRLQRGSNNNENGNELSLIKQAQNHIPGQHQITMLASNVKANMRSNRNRLQRWVGVSSTSQTQEVSTATSGNDKSRIVGLRKKTETPDYLNFHKNEDLTSKFREERDQRYEAWVKATIASAMTTTGKYKKIESVCTKSSQDIHRELHYFSRVIYGSTLSLAIDETDDQPNITSIVLETVSARRMLEVPDDDSSFLLRAQPRPIKPLRVWKDDQNEASNFRIYSAYYEVPVTHPVSKRFNGGKQIRHCYLRYFLSDRTATVTLSQNSPTIYLKRSQSFSVSPNSSTIALSEKIQKEKNPCQKALQKAPSMTTVMMMGNLMEPNDFNGTPRTGKAIDFVYKLSLFEKPVVEVTSKRFIVQDGNPRGVHRADASALELSDASLTAAIIISGEDEPTIPSKNSDDNASVLSTPMSMSESLEDEREENSNQECVNKSNNDTAVTSEDNTNLRNHFVSVSIRVKNSGGEGKDLIKKFRPSFIRAILLVASARQDAQLQCLIASVKSGSARLATRARTERLLQPTLALLDFANSKGRNKESILVRNLKFGSSHVERDILRRRKILNPRYPTFLRGLNAKVDGWVRTKSDAAGTITFTYKIRCLALIEVGIFEDDSSFEDDTKSHGNRKVYKEEWVITRSFREFMTLHKHLKTQMSPAAASGSITPRFAAATAAVFTAGNSSNDHVHQRKGLLLSLAHAAKAGALGVTKKSLDKRTSILDEYLRHLLRPRNLLRRCSELLQFLGADSPLEFDRPQGFVDALGRKDARRMQMDATLYPEIGAPSQVLSKARSSRTQLKKATSQRNIENEQNQQTPEGNKVEESEVNQDKETKSVSPSNKGKLDAKKMAQLALVKSRVEKVTLSDARETIFEFIRQLYDLDNATFFRSRIISALRTMSLVVTSSQEFNKVLLHMHLQYVNGKYLGSMVKSLCDTLWPDGVWYTAAPPMTMEEKNSLEVRAKEKLLEACPEKLKTILGQEISHDGLSVLHEMFQNKVVVKSLGYMIMDMVWLEVFPELYDVLSGTEALDNDE